MASDSGEIISGFQELFKKFKGIKTKFVSRLHEAAYKGDKDLLEQCMTATRIDINKQDELGNTPLHMAVEKEYADIVSILLMNKASVNARTNMGNTPLHLCRSVSVAQQLVRFGASINATNNRKETLLHLSTTSLSLTEYLLEHGAIINAINIDGETVLHQISGHNFNSENTGILQSCLKNGADVSIKDYSLKSPLHNASSSGTAEVVKVLLEHGAVLDAMDSSGHYPIHYSVMNFNYNSGNFLDLLYLFCPTAEATNYADNRGRSILHITAESYNETVIQFILDHGGNVNQLDFYGKTALHYAAKNKTNCEQVIETLIQTGIDVNREDHWGQATIHEALSNENYDCVKCLVRHKADLRKQDNNGMTPLHVACTKHNPVLADYLIECGADVNAVDKNNSTPLHVAAWSDSEKVIKVLLENGARIDMLDNLGETALLAASFKRCMAAASTLNNELKAISYFTKFANKHFELDTLCSMIKENGSFRMDEVGIADFLENILATPFVGRGSDDDEAKEIQNSVEQLVQALAEHINKKDPRLKCVVLHAGSSSEGTKTKSPDEFDFMFCLENLSKHIDVSFQQDDYSAIQLNVPSGSSGKETTLEERTMNEKTKDSLISISDYLKITLKQTEEASDFVSIFGSHEIPCFKMFNFFGELLSGIIFGKDFPRFTKILPLEVTSAPSLTLRWRGCRYKELIIDLDLVPAVILPSWSDKYQKDLALLTPEISQIVSVAVPKMSAGQDEDLWRSSLALVETAIFRNFQSHIRNSYIICKAMISSEILPIISFEDYSAVKYAYRMEHDSIGSEEFDNMIIYESPEKIIPSYILKMAFLSVVEGLAKAHGLDFVNKKTSVDYATGDNGSYTLAISEPGRLEDKRTDFYGETPSVQREASVNTNPFYGPAIDLYPAERSLDFNMEIVQEVVKLCLKFMSDEYVPSFFNKRHNVLGERILTGDTHKVETFIKVMKALIMETDI